MKTATASAEQATMSPMPLSVSTQKALLICGILSSILYIAMNIVAAARWQGYNSISQTVSELSAIGAPTRPLWVMLAIIYSLLVTGFGWGVRVSAGRNHPLSITGSLLVINGGLGMASHFTPMHLRGAVPTLIDTVHIILGTAIILSMLLAIGYGATAFGKRFRFYSITTILVILVFGTLMGIEGPRIAENLSTPFIGIWERISVLAFLIWVVVLAAILLRALEEYSKNNSVEIMDIA